MLAKSVRSSMSIIGREFFRNVHVSVVDLHPRSSRRVISADDKLQEDLDTIAEVESNMFAASSVKSLDVPKVEKKKPSFVGRLLSEEKPQVMPILTKPKQLKVSSPKLVDPELNLSYKKLHLNDPLLNKLLLSAKSRKSRDKKGQIIIEGRRLILDAIAAGLKLETLFFAQKDHLAEIKDDVRKCKDAQIIRVPQQDLRSWSTLVTCPGLIAIFRRPSMEDIEAASLKRKTYPITVVCDNVREPNNLGSIIRSCAAIPCAEVLVTKGCCDPWDTKALRGGCGAQFHVAIQTDLSWSQVDQLISSDSANSQSLVFLAENNTVNSKSFGVEMIPYDAVQINPDSDRCILVIGGETHGISEDAYSLLLKYRKDSRNTRGGCLHIPTSKYVDSLNTASAVTLLLFEIRKKLVVDNRDIRQNADELLQ